MGKAHLEPKIINQAQNEIRHQYLSASKARRLLNWHPQYSIDKALAETIKWYQTLMNYSQPIRDCQQVSDASFELVAETLHNPQGLYSL